MGKKSSKHKKSDGQSNSKFPFHGITGLLPIKNLELLNFDIENLVFSGGSAKDFSYSGAVNVLENLGILKGIKRFAGVGTGAIVATLLAVGYDYKSMQRLYSQLSDYRHIDNYIGYNKTIPTGSFGWNKGTLFLDWFVKLLETKSYESDITFMQLYKRSGKELCIVLTNISKGCTKYCHPKTTPDLPIREAVFMSLTIPGIYNIDAFKTKDDLYVHGGLLCPYPIHCFDGWWLSMNPEDSILKRLDVPSQYHTLEHVFDTRNPKTLGFLLIDKYIERDFKEWTDRLTISGGQTSIPNTTLGMQYKNAVKDRMVLEERFGDLRRISLELCKEAPEDENKEDIMNEETIAKKSLDDTICSLERLSFLFDENFEICVNYLKRLEIKDSKVCLKWLEHVFKKVILAILEEISDFYMTATNSLDSYFRTVFEIQQITSMICEKADFNRTIGIPCGHVTDRDDLADEDKIFLYRQGWNATVAFFFLNQSISRPMVLCKMCRSPLA